MIEIGSKSNPMDSSLEDKNSDSESINVAAWHNKINKSRQKDQPWRQRAKRCFEIYRADNYNLTGRTSSRVTGQNSNSFNILWANTQTLLPALFSKLPKPDVRNRFLAQNREADLAGQVIERNLSYSMEKTDFITEMKAAVLDYALCGRGTVRVRLLNETETVKKSEELDENDLDIQIQSETITARNTVTAEYVDWESIVIDPCKRWNDVKWIAFIHMLTKEEFEEFFPDAEFIEVGSETNQYEADEKYKVYEVWDKIKKRVLYLGNSDKPLRIQEDPFRLSGFFPIPNPIYSIRTNGTQIPIPEYLIYQDQARELNEITHRITDLVRSSKFIGVYDSSVTSLNDLLTSKDSQFTPVDPSIMRQGGIKSVIDILDTGKLNPTLVQLVNQRNQIKSIIYEITGISDIIRGESNASETATAQQIKASYAGLRLRDRREEINRFVVQLLRMQAEMITTFYSIEQMQEISGLEITPEVEHLLSSEKLINYAIDIETDSTIQADVNEESRRRVGVLTQIIQYMNGIAPFVKDGTVPMESAKGMLKWGLSTVKMTRELEDAIDMIGVSAMDEMPQMPPQMIEMVGEGMPQQSDYDISSQPLDMQQISGGVPMAA